MPKSNNKCYDEHGSKPPLTAPNPCRYHPLLMTAVAIRPRLWQRQPRKCSIDVPMVNELFFLMSNEFFLLTFFTVRQW